MCTLDVIHMVHGIIFSIQIVIKCTVADFENGIRLTRERRKLKLEFRWLHLHLFLL